MTDASELDSKYAPFPGFAAWAEISVDTVSWDQRLSSLEGAGSGDPSLFASARQVAQRAAAIDTGAIEGLYDLDKGFTITVAAQTAYWQAAYVREAERTRHLIEAQLAAYDQVIDLATRGAPFAEAWVRQLHTSLCEAQLKYPVVTSAGEQEQDLPLGEYKKYPNHVLLPDGSTHSYAPTLETPGEMARLLQELTSFLFLESHPILQAAYAHYGLAVIHPFADGNGRVARALASVFTYRGGSIPLMVLQEDKAQYLESLRAADAGEIETWVSFVQDRCFAAFQLVEQSLWAAKLPRPEAGRKAISRLYATKGGYTHAQVDASGHALLAALQNKLGEASAALAISDQLILTVHRLNQSAPEAPSGYRRPVSTPKELLALHINAQAPAAYQMEVLFAFWVPLDAGPRDPVIVTCQFNGQQMRVPLSNITPSISTTAYLQIAMYVDGILGAALEQVRQSASDALRNQGYLK